MGSSVSVVIGCGVGHWGLILGLSQNSFLSVLSICRLDIRRLTVSVPQPVPLQTDTRRGKKTFMFILPSLECVEPCLHFIMWLNGMMCREDRTLPSLVYMTLVCNNASNVCLKKCIHVYNIHHCIILLLVGNQSVHKGLNFCRTTWSPSSQCSESVLMELPVINVIPHVSECLCIGLNDAWDSICAVLVKFECSWIFM